MIGLGIVCALRAMTSEHVLSPPDDDERAVALITAFLGGGIGGLAELGITLTPTWPVPRDG